MADEDALFEKALARQMRDARIANGEPASQREAAGAYELCPDAEILAAYHERSLSNEEMRECKEHIISCARCQEILSQVEATETVLLEVSEEDRDAVVPEGAEYDLPAPFAKGPARRLEPRPARARREVTPLGAAQGSASKVAGVPSATGRAANLRSRKAYWIVPAGAIAASLLVWVGLNFESRNVPGNKSPEKTMETPVETAENRVAPPPAENRVAPPAAVLRDEATPKAAADEFAMRQDKKEIVRVPGKSKGTGVGTTGGAGIVQPSLIERKELDAYAKLERPPKTPAADTVFGKPQLQAREKSAARGGAGMVGGVLGATRSVGVTSSAPDVSSAQKSGVDNAPGLTGQQTQTLQAGAGQGVAPVVSPAQKSGVDDRPLPTGQQMQVPEVAANVAPTPSTLDEKTDTSSSLMTLSPGVAPTESTQTTLEARTLKTSAVKSARLIPVPGGVVVWRVGNGGVIEQSANAGGSWGRQESGVRETLDGGSAPSAAVCWVIGHAGTILQTVDGGGHWTKISSPISGDVGGIQAADALRATVWDASKKNNFMTVDGGTNWTRVANP